MLTQEEQTSQPIEDTKAKASKMGKSRSPSAKKKQETSKSPKGGKGKGNKAQKEETVSLSGIPIIFDSKILCF